jgi:fumarate reductase flavoprotein subunit
LFQTSTQFPSIKRFDEYFCVDLLVEDGRVQGAVVLSLATGEFTAIHARAVVIATRRCRPCIPAEHQWRHRYR